MLSAGFGRSQSRGWLWVSESGVLSSVTFSTGTAGVAQGPNVNPRQGECAPCSAGGQV